MILQILVIHMVQCTVLTSGCLMLVIVETGQIGSGQRRAQPAMCSVSCKLTKKISDFTYPRATKLVTQQHYIVTLC